MGKYLPGEPREVVTLDLPGPFLDKLTEMLKLKQITGNLFVEEDPVDMLGLVVAIETGRIPRPKPKKEPHR